MNMKMQLRPQEIPSLELCAGNQRPFFLPSGCREALPVCADDGLCRLKDIICGTLFDFAAVRSSFSVWKSRIQSKARVGKLQPRGQIQPLVVLLEHVTPFMNRLLCGRFHASATE